MTEKDPANRTALIEMAMGFLRGKVLCAAVRLGIADALEDGPKHLGDLAASTASTPDSLYRLLRALGGIGILEEVGPRRFALTDLGDALRKNAPNTVRASIVFWADLIADFWTYLPECVRADGNPSASAVMEREGVKSRWSMEPEAVDMFHNVFAEPTADDMAAFAGAYDFSRCKVVADLGGAGGGLLCAILSANRDARGVLVDRKEAVDGAASRISAAGFADRCDLVVGDLLEEVPSGADVYVLKSVLHGYGDDDARRILENCRTAMAARSRLLVIDAVLPARIDRPNPTVERMLLSDINMLAVTGGRERSETEWDTLLSSAGFERSGIVPVPGSDSSLIEAAPRG
ncbi:MAG: methyltransferase [Planctomycetota bacterium]|nr:methyltransferase [Planctomycetota bacterium]